MGKDSGQQGGGWGRDDQRRAEEGGGREQTEEEMRPEGQARKLEKLVKNKNPSDSMNTVRKM